MGVKAVKEHYRIGHIVHMADGLLCIGSPYSSVILSIGVSGEAAGKWQSNPDSLSNDDLKRYREEISQDIDLFLSVFHTEDQFNASFPVYTVNLKGELETHYCEERGWPNTTHDGILMFDNLFYPTKEKAFKYEKSSLIGIVNQLACNVLESMNDLQVARVELQERASALHNVMSALGGSQEVLSDSFHPVQRYDIQWVSAAELIEKGDVVNFRTLSHDIQRGLAIIFMVGSERIYLPSFFYQTKESLKNGRTLLDIFGRDKIVSEQLDFFHKWFVAEDGGKFRPMDIINAQPDEIEKKIELIEQQLKAAKPKKV